jgi:phosphoribosylformylglycinamidine synthase
MYMGEVTFRIPNGAPAPFYSYNEDAMKARVYVTMKPTVLDPQGSTIRSALAGLGHTSIQAVRQGKYFEITLAPGTDRSQAAAEIEQIAHDVLANPVIEEYRVEFAE